MKTMIALLAGSVVGVLVIFRIAFVRRIRINREKAMILYSLVLEHGRTMVIEEELARKKMPAIFDAICWLKAVGIMPFRFKIEERILRAGFQSTDSVVLLTAPRWGIKRLIHIIETANIPSNGIPVSLLKPWDADRLGSIDPTETMATPFVSASVQRHIDIDLASIVSGQLRRSGALLYGPPGNGKSYLIRYFAVKYELPIYVVSLVPDMTNHDVARMFSHLKGPAIVLIEDFDSYFDRRKCLIAEAKFTFDALLNVLDGTYTNLQGIFVFMTANNIEMISDALKDRPGRLRHVLQLTNPERSVRERVFAGHPDRAKLVKVHASLDKLLHLRDSKKPMPAIESNRKAG